MNSSLLKLVRSDQQLKDLLSKGSFGLEKEHIRIDNKGEIAKTKHPEVFEDKLNHPFVTNDFSESQVELITPVFDDIEQCYHMMGTLSELFVSSLEDELLWPGSAPPRILSEDDVDVAQFDDSPLGIKNTAYRNHLTSKYGKKKQTISGVHYNFSFDEKFIKRLYDLSEEDGPYRYFKDNMYLKLSRNLIRYSWLLTYLFGTSPATDRTYLEGCVMRMEKSDQGDPYFPYATSMRNGLCGYRNHNNYIVSYDSVDNYINEIKQLMADGNILDEREYYSPVRLKTHQSDDFMSTLNNSGILYIELRVLDLDPFDPYGIALDTLKFVHLFMMFMLFKEATCFGSDMHDLSLKNYEHVASKGREPGLMVAIGHEEFVEMDLLGVELLEEMRSFLQSIDCGTYDYNRLIDQMIIRFQEPETTLSAKVLDGVKKSGYIDYHKNLAEISKKALLDKPYILKGCAYLEMSTQILIKDAIRRGIHVEVLDKQENFILLSKDGHKKYIRQATKTDLDNYVTVLMMENKVVTKEILQREGISVPEGDVYESIDEAINDYGVYENQAFVVKPKSTNFGLGITIFKQGAKKVDFQRALELAFAHDNTVLVEEFVSGKEYRFFVLEGEVVGILHRVPANITGDGVNTIKQLVEIKNQDPLRGKGYKTPLEKIALGQVEEMFLAEQNLTLNSILDDCKQVYLRENSNISTGGDSLDYTDEIHEAYKQVAVAAAKAVEARICGVDMMIGDIKNFTKNHAIIELNFNPAIHIHCYPFSGKNRNLGNKILNILEF